MRVLAFDPYHTGSHRQFIETWSQSSRHDFAVIGLPGRHFKWRMRSAAVSAVEHLRQSTFATDDFDVIWTSSIGSAAELRALLPARHRQLPLVVYFHENQLVYPVRHQDPRDLHFSLTNWVSALAADSVWFNSSFNRDSFLDGMRSVLKRMPDERSPASLDAIAAKSRVEHLGIRRPPRPARGPGPLHIAWVGRWEHDKNPEAFFAALDALRARGVPFRLSCLGEHFRFVPEIFEAAKLRFADCSEAFGYIDSRSGYETALGQADVVVSTAQHEFFGVALLEAVAAGSIPVVPDRLVYPELYPPACLFDGSVASLVDHLAALSYRKQERGTLEDDYQALDLDALTRRFAWEKRASELDRALEEVSVLEEVGATRPPG